MKLYELSKKVAELILSRDADVTTEDGDFATVDISELLELEELFIGINRDPIHCFFSHDNIKPGDLSGIYKANMIRILSAMSDSDVMKFVNWQLRTLGTNEYPELWNEDYFIVKFLNDPREHSPYIDDVLDTANNVMNDLTCDENYSCCCWDLYYFLECYIDNITEDTDICETKPLEIAIHMLRNIDQGLVIEYLKDQEK